MPFIQSANKRTVSMSFPFFRGFLKNKTYGALFFSLFRACSLEMLACVSGFKSFKTSKKYTFFVETQQENAGGLELSCMIPFEN